MAACFCNYTLLQRACFCVPLLHLLYPSSSPSSLQMQRLRLRHHSQNSSRRQLQFDEAKLGQASIVLPSKKRQRTTGPAVLKETTGMECGSTAHAFLSSEREQKQDTGLSKLAATYRRRRSKQVQDVKDGNLDSLQDTACVGVQNGISRSVKGSYAQNSKGIVAAPVGGHGLPSGSVLKRVSRSVNGSSKQRYMDANAGCRAQNNNELNLAQANLSLMDEAIQELSPTDAVISVESSDSSHGDVGQYTQVSRVVDVTPLALHPNGLDVVTFDEGLLSLAVDTAIVYEGPFPSFSRPTQEECSEVCHRLSQLHGPLEEYAKHKIARVSEEQVLALDYQKEGDSKTITEVQNGPNSGEVKVAFPSGHPRERRTVLNSLVGTMLSQNTTDTNSRRAFASLKAKFPTWEEVYAADPKAVEDAIRCGGLAEIKTSRILNILKALDQERGKLCLEYVRNLSVDEIKLELSRFKGVGPKTVACVLMFHLQQNEFPVDTHVFRITKMLGWVPAKADREKAYLHLNHRIPNHLKFDLHCLLVTHGKRCPRCAKGGRNQKPADGPCPLVNLNLKCIETSPCDRRIEP